MFRVLFGRRLATSVQQERKIGAFAGVPEVRLDGLASSSCGPEAALTVLLPLGAGKTVLSDGQPTAIFDGHGGRRSRRWSRSPSHTG